MQINEPLSVARKPHVYDRYINAVSYLFIDPKMSVVHRNEVLTFEDSTTVLRETRIDFDLDADPVARHAFVQCNFSQGDLVPLPVGVFSKESFDSACIQGIGGEALPIIATSESCSISVDVLGMIADHCLAAQGQNWEPAIDGVLRTIVSGSRVDALAGLQQIEQSSPGTISYTLSQSNVFMGWAEQLASNFVLMTLVSYEDILKPRTVHVRAHNTCVLFREHNAGGVVSRWFRRLVMGPMLLPSMVVRLGATWWARDYYYDMRLPKEIDIARSELLLKVRTQAGVQPFLLDSFERPATPRVLRAKPVPAAQEFQRMQIRSDLSLVRYGLLTACFLATSLVTAALFAFYGYWTLDPPMAWIPSDYDRQSIVGILVLVPGLVATLSIRPTEHGLVAWMYLWPRTATILAAFLTVIVAGCIAIGVCGDALSWLVLACAIISSLLLAFLAGLWWNSSTLKRQI